MSSTPLFFSRRFAPMFWVQFLGAFNDNLLKTIVVLMVTYQQLKMASMGSEQVVPLASGLFILPYFLFSGQAGQLSDRLSKTKVIRMTKALEVVILLLATGGFYLSSLPLLLTTLLLMGTHSAFFGPAKYSILRELVPAQHLNAANALIEVGTFLAILLGTVAAGVLITWNVSPVLAGAAGVGLALAGLIVSHFLPNLKPALPELPFSINPFPSIKQALHVSRKDRSVYLAIMGISWFWFLGATIMGILPLLAKNTLQLPEAGVTYFLAVFCVGIAAGALLSEKMGGHKMELGLVPMGSFFLTVGLADWSWTVANFVRSEGTTALHDFVVSGAGMRISIDLLMVSVAGGLFTVPLYTLLQERTLESERGRVIAANNILNAIFMVAASLMMMVFSAADMPHWGTLFVLSIMNLAVAIYIYSLLPEFLLRLLAWCLAHLLYRIKTINAEGIPEKGAALLTPNHVSFVDWLLVASSTQRPIRFVMYYRFHQLPLLGFLFRHAKVIPIASKSEDAEVLERAMELIEATLREGELVCIFPEGALTTDGHLQPFRPGLLKVLKNVPVPVIPMGIAGMWGSFFSRKDKQAFQRPFRRVWSRVKLQVGAPIAADEVDLPELEERVAQLSESPRRSLEASVVSPSIG